jgi:glutamyl-tRNA reductase
MRFFSSGLSHHTAPIEVRESLAKIITPVDLALRRYLELESLTQFCIISTCNRVEFYGFGPGLAESCVEKLWMAIADETDLDLADLKPHLYTHYGAEAFRHLFRVSASLDSMVVGEPQILGQVKEAYQRAREQGTVGPRLMRIFEQAFKVAKRVRSETSIAENAVSMSFAAVELGKDIFDSLEGKNVLVIGAGKMSVLAAKHLRESGIGQIAVVNRSISRAQALAEQVDGHAYGMDALEGQLVLADIVISSTAAPAYVVSKSLMSGVVRQRRYRPILFVDIAVPRDIDPALGDLENVFVYDVDDLQDVVADNREARAKEAIEGENIVAEEVLFFVNWNRAQQVVPTIKTLRARTLKIARLELERNSGLSIAKLDAIANAITNKILHPVLQQLKAAGEEGDPSQILDVATRLFELEIDGLLYPESGIGFDDEDDSNVVPIKKVELGE